MKNCVIIDINDLLDQKREYDEAYRKQGVWLNSPECKVIELDLETRVRLLKKKRAVKK